MQTLVRFLAGTKFREPVSCATQQLPYCHGTSSLFIAADQQFSRFRAHCYKSLQQEPAIKARYLKAVVALLPNVALSVARLMRWISLTTDSV
jgi:hypothetical protein